MRKLLIVLLTFSSLAARAEECRVVAETLAGVFLEKVRPAKSKACEVGEGEEIDATRNGEFQRLTFKMDVKCAGQKPFALLVEVDHYEDGLCLTDGRVYQNLGYWD